MRCTSGSIDASSQASAPATQHRSGSSSTSGSTCGRAARSARPRRSPSRRRTARPCRRTGGTARHGVTPASLGDALGADGRVAVLGEQPSGGADERAPRRRRPVGLRPAWGSRHRLTFIQPVRNLRTGCTQGSEEVPCRRSRCHTATCTTGTRDRATARATRRRVRPRHPRRRHAVERRCRLARRRRAFARSLPTSRSARTAARSAPAPTSRHAASPARSSPCSTPSTSPTSRSSATTPAGRSASTCSTPTPAASAASCSPTATAFEQFPPPRCALHRARRASGRPRRCRPGDAVDPFRHGRFGYGPFANALDAEMTAAWIEPAPQRRSHPRRRRPLRRGHRPRRPRRGRRAPPAQFAGPRAARVGQRPIRTSRWTSPSRLAAAFA